MKRCLRSSFTFVCMVFSFGASAGPIQLSVSQMLTFPEIEPREYLVGTEGTFDLGVQFSAIDLIRLTFDTLDPIFNSGVGPNGGESGVELAVLAAGQTPERFGIASVVSGNQVVTLYPGSGDPLQRFEIVAQELLDGTLTVSLGAWEGFNTYSQGYPLLYPSRLTLEVRGFAVAVPEPPTLLLLSSFCGFLVVWRKHIARRMARASG